MFYSETGAKTLFIGKGNNNPDWFYSYVKPLIFRMIKQGAHNDKLTNAFF